MLSIIAVIGKNRELGKDNKLLWHIPGDLPRFKKLTIGHSVIMGRKTFESIGHPLPDRKNIVISHSAVIPGVTVVGSVEDALKEAGPGEVFVIGGAKVFAQTIDIADRLYLTVVDKTAEADAFFPDYSRFTRVIKKEPPYLTLAPAVKVIIWDFDGTLYPQDKEVSRVMEEKQYETIMRRMGWSRQKAKEEFWKVYPSRTTSGNAAVGLVCGMTTAEAAIENEIGFDRLQFFPKDHHLPDFFAALKQYRHFILGNGVRVNLQATIDGLRIPKGTFEEIVTSETVGANKPDPAGFLYIMEKTGLAPSQHLMVGDREVVDLAPAKKLGMQTCLVTWGEGFAELPQTGKSVDITIPTPYDLPKILTE